MRSSDVSMAALLILNMTTCYFGILARSHSRGVRSIVATRLSIRLTTSTRLKSVVNRDSISDRNTVGVVREAYHGKQFCKLFIGHPLRAGRSGVGRDAIGAIIGNADRDVDQFLR